MTTQTEALKLALEAHKKNERHLTLAETRYWCDQYKLLATQAIEALAQPEQEPVAVDAQCDRFYLRGLQAGFSLGQMGDEAGFAAACRSYQKHLTEAAHGIKEQS